MINFFKRKPEIREATLPADVSEDISDDDNGEHINGHYISANKFRNRFANPEKEKGALSISIPYPQVYEDKQKEIDAKKSSGVGMDSADYELLSFKNAFSVGRYNAPDSIVGWYSAQGFLGHQVAAIMAQHWLIEKACRMPGEDAIRKGYYISRADGDDITPEELTFIEELDKKYDVRRNLMKCVKFANIFGIRAVLFKVRTDDPDKYYKNPFNIDAVSEGSYEGMVQIDPYWMAPQATELGFFDPTSDGFYMPEFWTINGRTYHKSHFVIIIPHPVADILKPSYLYGGLSVPQMIYERVYAAEATANEAPNLAKSKRLNVLKTDIESAMADWSKFFERMIDWVRFRDNYGVKIADVSEEIETIDTSLADLDAVIMSQYQIVAAIAGVPSTKLLGTSPKGFNATGEYEEASYHEKLEGIQSDVYNLILDRHYDLVMKSDFAPQFGRSFDIDITWSELDSVTEKERAEIGYLESQTFINLINAGSIDGKDIRTYLKSNRESVFYGLAELGDDDGEMDFLQDDPLFDPKKPDETPREDE